MPIGRRKGSIKVKVTRTPEEGSSCSSVDTSDATLTVQLLRAVNGSRVLGSGS